MNLKGSQLTHTNTVEVAPLAHMTGQVRMNRFHYNGCNNDTSRNWQEELKKLNLFTIKITISEGIFLGISVGIFLKIQKIPK